MPQFEITSFDCFFLSYDEPNADRHYADLLEKAPYAERIHGVKGFDAAHRACAEASTTDWFVTVDADNIVLPEFFDQVIDLDPVATPNRCLSWNSVNMINGLKYGNGGLKLWSKQFVLNMRSHENADDPRKAVDFCWEKDYQQVHRTFSETWVNGSAYQAFKAGFREGVKLTLDRGERVRPEEMKKKLHPVNLRNARIWSCVGADIEHGTWAMLGTRLGWDSMCDLAFDHTMVNDYEAFKDYWAEVVKTVDLIGLTEVASDVGLGIDRRTGISLPILGERESEFFRSALSLRND